MTRASATGFLAAVAMALAVDAVVVDGCDNVPSMSMDDACLKASIDVAAAARAVPRRAPERAGERGGDGVRGDLGEVGAVGVRGDLAGGGGAARE